MSMQQRVLQEYAALNQSIGQMLVCAEGGDWERLVMSGQDYASTMEKLVDMEVDVCLDGVSQSQKLEMIQDIRATEKQLRSLLDDRMSALTESITAMRQQNQVKQAYMTT